MIKNEMNLPLGTDTTNIKATTAVFLSATDEQITPYTIGFVPWDLMSKCVLFGKCAGVFLNSTPNTYFSSFINRDYYFNPDRGIPFVYTVRTGYDGRYMHANYAENAWHTDQMVGDQSNTNLQILHAYNTDYFVQNNFAQNVILSNLLLQFKIYEVIGDGGWTGNTFQSVFEHPYASVTASISDIGNIGITFNHSLASHFGTYNYTITQDNWLNCDEHGIFIVEGDDYVSGGQTYKRRLYCACVHASTPPELETSGTTPGYGVLIDTGYRSTPQASNSAWACGWGRCQYGLTSDQFYKINPYAYQRQFPSPYGYDSDIETGVYFFRQATIEWFNHLLYGGATYEDIVVMICTAWPMYKINNAYYVAEFTDDYYITGKLIPYANARDWQKNINGDTNVFNPADIPEPTPPGDEGENVGDSVILPSVFGVGTTNGFVTQYALRKTDIQQLGALLWTSFVDADYWQNYLFSLALDTGTFSLAGLMSFFVSLKVYPFPLVNVSGLVSEGGNDMYVGTGIVPLHFTNKLHSLTSYVDKIEGGYVDVMSNYFFKDWRDYVNTEIILYVPYCGTIHLNPADVVGNRVRIRYVIDFSTGGCVAYVMCDAAGEKSFMIGALPGQIGADVPLSATAAGEIAARFIGDAMNAGHLVGGEVGNIAGGIASGLSGNTPGAGGGNVLSGIAGVYGGLPAAMGADLAPGVASQALSMLTRGAVSAPLMSGGRGFASFGAPQIPYIQIRRGIYPEISKLSEISGKPSAGSYKVGDLSGFVSGVVKTDGINAHENEKAKIRRLIAGGIYV